MTRRLSLFNAHCSFFGTAAKLLLLLLVIGQLPFSESTAAEKPLAQYVVHRYQKDQGLASPSILELCQTSDGYLWIGTYNGINRFNGRHFAWFNPKNTQGLESDQITALCETQNGELWMGSPGGGIIGYRDNNLTQIIPNSIFPNVSVNELLEDRDGLLWAGTHSGLYRFENQTWKLVELGARDQSPNVQDLCLDDQGRLYVATENKVFRQNNEGFAHIEWKDQAHITISTLAWTPKGGLWIGTTGNGLYAWKSGKITHYTKSDGLLSLTIGALLPSRDGSLWIGCRGGITRFSQEGIDSLTMPGELVYALCEDREHGLWLGTYQNGLSRLDQGNALHYQASDRSVSLVGRGIAQRNDDFLVATNLGLYCVRNDSLQVCSGYSGSEEHVIRSITPSQDGGLWLSTHSNGLVYFDKENHPTWYGTQDGLLSQTIRSTLEDSQGNLWIGTSEGLNVFRDGEIHVDERIPRHTTILTIHEGRDGSIIVGTDHSGLYLLQDNEVLSFNNNQGLAGTVVFYVYEDENANLWISTNAGLARLKDGRIDYIDSLNGLPSDSVFFTVEDALGNFWMAYDNALYSCNKADIEACLNGSMKKLSVRIFGKDDGVNADGITGVAHPWVDEQQRIWIPTLAGVAVIDPHNIHQNNVKPPVLIESLHADQQRIPIKEDQIISLDADTQRISFSFASLSFKSPEQNQFEIKLEGFDRDWINIGNAHERSYTQLGPGKYTFRVRASNNDGVWNETGSSLTFVKKSHYYETAAFYIMLAALLILILIAAYLLRTRQLRRQKRLLKLLVEKKTADLQKALEQAENATSEARQALKTKSRFLATMGHEVRNPMNAIIGLSEMLLETKLDEKQHQYIETIKNSSSALTFVLNDLLDFSKLESGKISLELIEFNPRKLLAECATLMHPRINEKNLEYQTSIDPSIPHTLLGDPARIRQVLINLISNAIKFTEHGGIRVEASLASESGESCLIRISVVDTGIGISAEDQKKLFRPYQQAQLSTFRQYGGTGLGLAICKSLCELMGGKIGLRSSQGEGSTFYFSIPLHHAPERFNASGDRSGNRAFGQSEKPLDILIVDDNEINRKITAHMLKSIGRYNIELVADGQSALQKLEEKYYDAMILDKYMPGIDGTEVARKIRSREVNVSNSGIYIIGFSGATGEEERNGLLASGMNDVIDKPIDVEELSLALVKARRMLALR